LEQERENGTGLLPKEADLTQKKEDKDVNKKEAETFRVQSKTVVDGEETASKRAKINGGRFGREAILKVRSGKKRRSIK